MTNKKQEAGKKEDQAKGKEDQAKERAETEEMSSEQLVAHLESLEVKKDEDFLAEYKKICEKYSRSLTAEMALRSGMAPAVTLYVARHKNK